MRKHLLLCTFCLSVLLCIFMASIIVSDGSMCGDANGDGDFNIGDAVYTINHVFKSGPGPDTSCCETSTVTDFDGNVYRTVKIGDQWWMAENLKVAHYRNGDPIPNVVDNVAWRELAADACCVYNNDPANVAIYGKLYNWYAISDNRNIAPEGWHVPTDYEWKQMEMYLGMSQTDADAVGWRGTDEGGKLKEICESYWATPNVGATNETGFSAIPGGYRVGETGAFVEMDYFAYFWSTSESVSYPTKAIFRNLYHNNSIIGRGENGKKCGKSIRCVRD